MLFDSVRVSPFVFVSFTRSLPEDERITNDENKDVNCSFIVKNNWEQRARTNAWILKLKQHEKDKLKC